MNFEPAEIQTLDHFRSISTKLKKRFLRKPNVTEACEDYTALAREFENNEIPDYAAMCWISAARCEGSVGNITAETICLERAGRQFLAEEEGDHQLGLVTTGMDLQAAKGCFSYASSRHPEDSPAPISLNLEMVEYFKRTNRPEKIEGYLMHALEQAKENELFETHVLILTHMATHYIEMKNFSGALNCYNQLVDLLEVAPLSGAYAQILLRCEIGRVFILLILKPPAQKLAPKLTKLLEKYMWEETCDDKATEWGMSLEIFLCIQSIVIACQSMNTERLDEVESELWPLIGEDERALLRVLVKIYLK